MRPIFDRTAEHLETCDAMVIRTRRRNAVKAVQDRGQTPPGGGDPTVYLCQFGSGEKGRPWPR